MVKNCLEIVDKYYASIGNKDVQGIVKYLDDEIQLVGPLGTVNGKEAYIEAAKRFTERFTTLKVRAKQGSGNQAMIVYDIDCPEPLGKISSAALMTFKDGVVKKIELFYDARPFEKK